MAEVQDREMTGDDEYDEEADSDFEAHASGPEDASSGSDNDDQETTDVQSRPRKRQKIEKTQTEVIIELDSGDEATIQEQKKPRKKGKTEADGLAQVDGNESEGWRARTRAMRTKEKDERRKHKLASSKGSTIDVNKIWEEMNSPAPAPPPRVESDVSNPKEQFQEMSTLKPVNTVARDSEKENVQANDTEETITIKRTYQFAGQVHVEEKTVVRSSAEAQLWLSQQQSSKGSIQAGEGRVVNRPLRKLSRFDPNFSNMDAFKGSWTATDLQQARFKGPKLNVVEKSKMDWAAHVDTEGLKEELDTHAKAKEGYLTRMDFLKEVEDRKEAEARAARVKAR